MIQKHPVAIMTGFLALCEFAAVGLTVLVYYLLGHLTLPVVLGALLGALVMVGNFAALSVISSRAVDAALSDKKRGEMTEEEIEAFVAEHQTRLKLRIRLSQNIRMVMMLALLVVALVTPWFDPIAALIPMLLFRPFLFLEGFVFKGSPAAADTATVEAEESAPTEDAPAAQE